MGKYLELFRGEVGDLTEKTKLENKPYVAYSTKLGKVTYTVVPEPEQPVSYEAVDLGLPSGLKWANMNVGAASPEDAGFYFYWGETTPNIDYDEGKYYESGNLLFGITYKKYNENDNKTKLDLEDDAAYVHMGSDWRMPTLDEIEELINNTKRTYVDMNDHEYTAEDIEYTTIMSNGNFKGTKFVGPNGNSIFIPADADYLGPGNITSLGQYSHIWTSELYRDFNRAHSLYVDINDHDGRYVGILDDCRHVGCQIRGVKA